MLGHERERVARTRVCGVVVLHLERGVLEKLEVPCLVGGSADGLQPEERVRPGVGPGHGADPRLDVLEEGAGLGPLALAQEHLPAQTVDVRRDRRAPHTRPRFVDHRVEVTLG